MGRRSWTYIPSEPSAIAVDRPFYERIAEDTDDRLVTHSHTVPIRSGYAGPVKAGQVCRIIAIEGPQVVDFNCWNLHNPRERFWAARTRQLESSHLTDGNRLWSVLPYLRPMLTITRETVRYGEDEDGGRCHDLLGSRCDPYVTKLLSGETFDFNCHANLTRAVLPWHLNEWNGTQNTPRDPDVHERRRGWRSPGRRSRLRHPAHPLAAKHTVAVC